MPPGNAAQLYPQEMMPPPVQPVGYPMYYPYYNPYYGAYNPMPWYYWNQPAAYGGY